MAAPTVSPKRGSAAAKRREPRPQFPPRKLAYDRDPLDGMPLLSPAEVAEALNVPARTLSEWRYRGKHLRYYSVGNSVRYDPNDVADFLTRAMTDADTSMTTRERAGVRRWLADAIAEIRARGITDVDAIVAFIMAGGLGGIERDADEAERAAEDRLDS